MKTAFVFLSVLAVAAASLPAQAATIGGFEISGIARHGDENTTPTPALEHYYDAYLLTGQVVNAFGTLAGAGPFALSGLPIHFNQAGPAACAEGTVRVPLYDQEAQPYLQQSYGRFWFHEVNPVWYPADYGSGSPCRQGLTVAVGAYLFTAPGLQQGYDHGLGQIVFAGIGTLSDGLASYAADIFLTTEFDTPAAPYQMLIRAIDPSVPSSAPLPAPVPVPPAGPLALLGLGLLAGAGWRRPAAGKA